MALASAAASARSSGDSTVPLSEDYRRLLEQVRHWTQKQLGVSLEEAKRRSRDAAAPQTRGQASQGIPVLVDEQSLTSVPTGVGGVVMTVSLVQAAFKRTGEIQPRISAADVYARAILLPGLDGKGAADDPGEIFKFLRRNGALHDEAYSHAVLRQAYEAWRGSGARRLDAEALRIPNDADARKNVQRKVSKLRFARRDFAPRPTQWKGKPCLALGQDAAVIDELKAGRPVLALGADNVGWLISGRKPASGPDPVFTALRGYLETFPLKQDKPFYEDTLDVEQTCRLLVLASVLAPEETLSPGFVEIR